MSELKGLTAETLEAMNTQEMFQLAEKYTVDEFHELQKKYESEWWGIFQTLLGGAGMEEEREALLDRLFEIHRREVAMYVFYKIKSRNMTAKQLNENVLRNVTIKRDMAEFEADVREKVAAAWE